MNSILIAVCLIVFFNRVCLRDYVDMFCQEKLMNKTTLWYYMKKIIQVNNKIKLFREEISRDARDYVFSENNKWQNE